MEHYLATIDWGLLAGDPSVDFSDPEMAELAGIQTEGSQPVMSNFTVPNLHVSFTSGSSRRPDYY